jgi:hypothetical protein
VNRKQQSSAQKINRKKAKDESELLNLSSNVLNSQLLHCNHLLLIYKQIAMMKKALIIYMDFNHEIYNHHHQDVTTTK